jgi:hypothetical protein
MTLFVNVFPQQGIFGYFQDLYCHLQWQTFTSNETLILIKPSTDKSNGAVARDFTNEENSKFG